MRKNKATENVILKNTRKENYKLMQKNADLQLKNKLLRELLECHSIKLPKEIDDYLNIDLKDKDAYIFSELQSIDAKLELISDIVVRLQFK